MQIKKILAVAITILVSSSAAFALTYKSPNYSLLRARIVVSCGQTESYSYRLNDVRIGNIFGGKIKSANYSLNAAKTDKKRPPNPPTLNSVTTPTNIPRQTLSGRKDGGTSIYINGYQVVPLDREMTWSYDIALTPGDNYLIITARNSYDLESGSIITTIVFNQNPPQINAMIPADGSSFYQQDTLAISVDAFDPDGDTLQYQFYVDGQIIQAWTISSTYNWIIPTSAEGLRTIKIEVSDGMGGLDSKSVQVYIFLKPISPPLR